MDLIKLTFKSPLISRTLGIDNYTKIEELVHSDSFFSALIFQAMQINEEVKNNPTNFIQSCTISSCFPYFNDILFFPKPTNFKPNPIDSTDFKKNKKVKYISKETLIQYINQEKIINENYTNLQNGEMLVNKNELNFKENNVLFLDENTQHVNLVNQQKPEPYYLSRLIFNKDSGLYFFVNWQKEEEQKYKPIFMQALQLLGDTGIGSYRTTGNGQFEINKFEENYSDSNLIINNNFTKRHCLNLSIFIPSYSEINLITNDEETQYQLIKRGGFITNSNLLEKPTRKKIIYGFKEGSIFSNNNLVGELVDLKPTNFNHPIWRNGKSIFIYF